MRNAERRVNGREKRTGKGDRTVKKEWDRKTGQKGRREGKEGSKKRMGN